MWPNLIGLLPICYIIFRMHVPFQRKHRMQIRKPCRVWETHVSNVCLHYVPLQRGYEDTEGHHVTRSLHMKSDMNGSITYSDRRGSAAYAINNQEHLSNSIPVHSESFLVARFMGPTWGPSGGGHHLGGPHVGPMDFAIWDMVSRDPRQGNPTH